jgi:hypothetical protein
MTKRALAAAVVIAAAGFPATAIARPAVHRPAPQTTPSANPSFEWGDAGVGAAAAIALMGSGAIGASAIRRRRIRRIITG